MNVFRKSAPAKQVLFVVDYDDDRRAYLWIDDPASARDIRTVGLLARTRQEQGVLPEGTITNIRRVR